MGIFEDVSVKLVQISATHCPTRVLHTAVSQAQRTSNRLRLEIPHIIRKLDVT